MKVSIDEISKFIAEGWPKPADDWYMEDEGPGWQEHLNDADYSPKQRGALVELGDFECAILHQGSNDDPTSGDGYSFVKLFVKWKKSLSTVMLAVECPREKLDIIKTAIRSTGGKVVA